MSLPELSRLGYGAANLGNLHRVLSDDESWAILDAAWESGIRYYDTAPHYGLGVSERRLGAFLRTKPRDEYVVSTKAGRLLRHNPDPVGLDVANGFHVPDDLRREWDFSAEGIRASLDESLERMGLDRIDLLYLHDPEHHDVDLAISEAFPALAALRDSGVVSAVGVGSMTSEVLLRAATEADIDAEMVAGRYTLLEQPAADAVDACADRGIGVVAASVFNSGLLASSEPRREGRYEYGSSLPDELWDRLVRITEVCNAHAVPLPAAAVQFPLRAPATASVIVGGSRPEQLRQNAELMQVRIPDALWADLAAATLIPA
jgi:D-threo-aldose 1-dehydrogenase